jgi:tRNA pseudouridine13 synthase
MSDGNQSSRKDAADSIGDPTRDLPRAYGAPPGQGRIRVQPEDFRVEERLGYGPDGEGEHAFLVVRKRNLNTHDLARRIARRAGVPQVGVGYAGLKDRNAVTVQAFTVHLPGRRDPDWSRLESEEIEILEVARHSRKIRRGSLRGNRFVLQVRDLEGDREILERRLTAMAAGGAPNYFGAQRFGNRGDNLARATALFEGDLRVKREQRSILLSAVRSQLFNRVLAERVAVGSWNQAQPGEVMLLDGTKRQFAVDEVDTALRARCEASDIHPSGPLYGRPSRSLRPRGAVAALEERVMRPFALWRSGLEGAGLDADRRALRTRVRQLEWHWPAIDRLVLSFELGSGSYATAVLRELIETVADAGDRGEAD